MNALGSKFTYNDLDDIKNINDVKDVSLKLELTMNDSKNEDKSYLVSIIDDMFNELEPDFNYLDYVPFNYVMVSLKNKAHEATVKRNIEDNIDNAMAVISIEDTTSYSMYQGEIDEGEAYVGIFSGLFFYQL